MSVYGTWLALDGDEHETSCRQMVHEGDRVYRLDTSKPCTCSAAKARPLVYQGSHVVPDDDDRRGGYVMVCAIPAFCHPAADNSGATADYSHPVNFLRLSVAQDVRTYGGMDPGEATVVLDRPLVTELRDTLTAWLERDGDRT